MTKVYLAGPFFTPAQAQTMQTLEDMLQQCKEIHAFSPRQTGIVLKDLTPDERAVRAKEVYTINVNMLDWCDVVLAVIDDRDTGTIWEMGYAAAKGKRIVSYSSQNYGLNVMLQSCVCAHVVKLPDLAYLFQHGVRNEDCTRIGQGEAAT